MEEDSVKMDPAKKARIVAALRSGQYEQAKGMLAAGQLPDDPPAQFCALGVICEEYRREYPDEYTWAMRFDNDDAGYEFDLVPRETYEKLAAAHKRGEIDTRSFNNQLEDLFLGSGLLPKAVVQWLGLPDNWDRAMPVRDQHAVPITVPVLNDVRRLSLAQIADLIDQQL